MKLPFISRYKEKVGINGHFQANVRGFDRKGDPGVLNMK